MSFGKALHYRVCSLLMRISVNMLRMLRIIQLLTEKNLYIVFDQE